MVIALTANRCCALDRVEVGPRLATLARMLKVSKTQRLLPASFGAD